MKTKVVEINDCMYIPVIKRNWYGSWKYISKYQNIFILHKSCSNYFRDIRIDLLDCNQDAKNTIDGYLKWLQNQQKIK